MEPGENVLVLQSGYFGDSFTEWCASGLLSMTGCSYFGHSLETYGAKVDKIKSEIGYPVAQDEIERALKAKKYKILTVTHVDTSTGT